MFQQFVKSSKLFTGTKKKDKSAPKLKTIKKYAFRGIPWHSNGGTFEKFVRVDKKPHFFGLFLAGCIEQRRPLALVRGRWGHRGNDGRVGPIQVDFGAMRGRGQGVRVNNTNMKK